MKTVECRTSRDEIITAINHYINSNDASNSVLAMMLETMWAKVQDVIEINALSDSGCSCHLRPPCGYCEMADMFEFRLFVHDEEFDNPKGVQAEFAKKQFEFEFA